MQQIDSKFDGKCKDCGKEYKIGTKISTNGNKSNNTKGELKSHWCPDGENCSGVKTSTSQIIQTAKANNTLENRPTQESIEPSSTRLLDIAKEILCINLDNDNDNESHAKALINEITIDTKIKAATMLVKLATLNDIMDEAGIQHPSRMAFIRNALECN